MNKNPFEEFDNDFKAFHKTMRWALGGAFVLGVLVIVVAVLR